MPRPSHPDGLRALTRKQKRDRVRHRSYGMREHKAKVNGAADTVADADSAHGSVNDKLSAINSQHVAGQPLRLRMAQQSDDVGHVFGRGKSA